MTTHDIIKMLPVEEDVKVQMLRRYETMDKYEKLSFEELVWNSYFSMYDEQLRENLGMQYEKVQKGEEPDGNDLYARALKKTEQEMTTELQESKSTVDLAAARKAMEQIIGEIRATKADKKNSRST